MRKLWLAGLAALVLAAAGCGSDGETTTVTETVGGGSTESADESADDPAIDGSTPTASTIPDGTWKRGEYKPGTYRVAGGETCSWEQTELPGGEKEGESFNDNYGIGEKNILIKIDSPYFKTEDCGTWERVE